MSLLREIQSATVDQNTDLPTVLRKCKVLAARLRSDSFKKWVDHELNGYSDRQELPEYRVLTVGSYGNFSGSFGSAMNKVPIPPVCIPEKHRAFVTASYMMAPISSYIDLASREGDSQEPWPADALVRFGADIYDGMHCIAAWKLIPRNSLVGVIDTVRNRVLSFVLEIEEAAPDAGEAPPNTEPVPQERVSQIFNTYISGTVHNVATGSSNFSQIADATVKKGDLQSLVSLLRAYGLTETDICELKDALSEDASKEPNVPFGKRITTWMGEMIGKAAKGAWKVSTEVASNVLSKALQKYFGLDSE